METIQGATEMLQGFQFSLPMAGMVLSTAVLIAFIAKGKLKQGLILFGSFILFQVYTANKGILANTLNTVEASGDSVSLLMGFAGFSLGTLALLACLTMIQGRN